MRVVADATKLRQKLEATRDQLLKLRSAPPPPVDPNHDRPHVQPVHDHPPSRADGLWPFLLLRRWPGDFGARPITMEQIRIFRSPDIIVTNYLATDPFVLDRAQFGLLAGRVPASLPRAVLHTVWVHVWNLGRAPAYGVRVRAWLQDYGTNVAPGNYIGGRQVDLGDRSSATSHRVVNVGQFSLTPLTDNWIWATAECITDVSSGSTDAARLQDRHSAMRYVPATDRVSPNYGQPTGPIPPPGR